MEKLLKESVNLEKVNYDLFDEVAEQIAQALNNPQIKKSNRRERREETRPCRTCNKSSQIRRFYEDVLKWEDKIQAQSDIQAAYREYLPFIKMLNAKVAYAYSREKVDEQFKQFINHCIRSLTEDKATFDHFKLLFEAVIGFMKNKQD